MLGGTAGTTDVTDATVVLTTRRFHATVISSELEDLEVLDPTLPAVDC